MKELDSVFPKELIPAMQAKLEAETEKEQALTRSARASARSNEIELEKKEIEYSRMMASDFFYRRFYFDSDVNDKSVGFCMDQLDQWDRMNPKGTSMEIVFTSPGGSVTQGLALFDAIQILRRKGHTIDTTCLGVAASMAGILLQAGETRSMTKESWLLIHQVSAGMMGSYGELKDRLDWLTRTQERILDIFADRAAASGVEKPITRAQIKKNWTRTDWWLSSDQALAYGLIDEVR